MISHLAHYRCSEYILNSMCVYSVYMCIDSNVGLIEVAVHEYMIPRPFSSILE